MRSDNESTLKDGESVTSFKSSRALPYLYVFPLVVFSGVFLYYALGFTLFTSFHDWNGISKGMSYIGTANYHRLFRDPTFFGSIRNVLIFFVVTVGIQAMLGFLIAVFFREPIRARTLYQAIFFIPVVMSPAVISAIFRIILDPNVGQVNETLHWLKWDALALSWLGDPKIALFSIIGVNVFQWMGFSMMLYYSSLLAIPEEIYEAARIDGCGFWNTIFRITFPLVKGTHALQIVFGILGSLKTFDIVYLLTGGGPGHYTEFLTTYLYKTGLQDFNGGYASTIGTMIVVIAVVFAVMQIQLSNRKS
jgi:raffinose/stachyose/melibiose transport system permease protein